MNLHSHTFQQPRAECDTTCTFKPVHTSVMQSCKCCQKAQRIRNNHEHNVIFNLLTWTAFPLSNHPPPLNTTHLNSIGCAFIHADAFCFDTRNVTWISFRNLIFKHSSSGFAFTHSAIPQIAGNCIERQLFLSKVLVNPQYQRYWKGVLREWCLGHFKSELEFHILFNCIFCIWFTLDWRQWWSVPCGLADGSKNLVELQELSLIFQS